MKLMGYFDYSREGKTVSSELSALSNNVRVPQQSCVRDEGGPLAIGLQEQVANHRKRLGSKAPVVSVTEKASRRCQV